VPDSVHILLVSGSLRSGSTNSALLRTAAAVAPPGVTTATYEGLADLPHFNPDDDAEGLVVPTPVDAMRAEIAAADAILFSTPEYPGALPGSFKNMLEWTVGDASTYRKPVAWVNAAAPGRGAHAEDSLRTVPGYVGADIAEDACVRLTVERDAISEDGTVADPEFRARLTGILEALAAHVRRRREETWSATASTAT
jgi:NAD(P)H-dependent FMN reductase